MRIGFPIFLGAGLALLPFAFLLSLPVGNGMSEYYNALIKLEASPSISFLWWATLYGILPIAISLAFITVAYIKAEKTLTEGNSFKPRLFGIIGGLCILWGTIYFVASSITCFGVISRLGISGIDVFLMTFYLIYDLIGVIWILSGVFLMKLRLPPEHS